VAQHFLGPSPWCAQPPNSLCGSFWFQW
jgi:hypothetical protein